jgi:asparagine synthase (glutamine-hydrolysing)
MGAVRARVLSKTRTPFPNLVKMCGIWAALKAAGVDAEAALAALRARGPEYAAAITVPGVDVRLGFTRLAINGLTPAGHQPLVDDTIHLVCNGEIYNYKALAARHGIALPEGSSDCAVLPALFKRLTPVEFCNALDGVFALVLVDTATNTLYAARDPYGVRPLFYAHPRSGGVVFASEIKGLPRGVTPIPFPPGHIAAYDATTGALKATIQYHAIPTQKIPAFSSVYSRTEATHALNVALTEAVKKRLMSDRPIGALLSGGVDSSLVAAIAARELRKTGKRLTTFSIGLPGSTDLEYADKVAKHIDSDHHQIVCSPEEFLAAIPAVVAAIESYDITTIRASVGNYLVGKYIKEHTDIKVVFNGDGSDEIGGGYLYFYNAPTDEAFETETTHLLNEIHLYDVLRSDRCMAAHGLEARTPFLDKGVVATWRAMGTVLRRPRRPDIDGRGAQMEKQILREAFESEGLLPFEVLWRRKEAFSDGVSSTADSWYKRCEVYAHTAGVKPSPLERFSHNPPYTLEADYYRQLFEAQYGSEAASFLQRMWLPKWSNTTDPSARTLVGIY